MLPANTIDNPTNLISTNVELFSNILLRHPFSGKATYFSNFIFRHGSHWMLFSKIAAFFLGHICHIIGMGSKKEMIGIYTGRIVAGMKYALSFWKYLIMRKFPHEMMGKNNPFAIPNSSISSLIFTAGPKPTLRVHGYIVPDTKYLVNGGVLCP